MSEPLFAVDDLQVEFRTDDGVVHAVDRVSYSLERGEVLAILGESGSGKTVHARAVMRILDSPPAFITGGSVRLGDIELLTLEEADMREVRGSQIAMLFQDPHTALDPVFTVGAQLVELLAGAERRVPARGERCRDRVARARGHRHSSRAPEGVPAPAVRGDRTARDGGHGRRAGAGGAARRRAHVVARRHGPGAGPGAAAIARGREPYGDGPDHAQLGGGGGHRRSHRRDVRGPDRRAGSRSTGLLRSRSIRTRRRCFGRSPTSRCARSVWRRSRAHRRTCSVRRPGARSTLAVRWPTTGAGRRSRRRSR